MLLTGPLGPSRPKVFSLTSTARHPSATLSLR